MPVSFNSISRRNRATRSAAIRSPDGSPARMKRRSVSVISDPSVALLDVTRQQDGPLGLPDEGDDLLNQGIVLELGGSDAGAVKQRAFAGEDLPIGRTKAMDGLALDLTALEAHQIEPAQHGAIAHGHAIGNDITIDH